MSFSERTPSFGIVRRCFMASPQERHAMVRRVVRYRRGKFNGRGLRARNTDVQFPLNQAGALPNSQLPTPGTGPLSVMKGM